MRNQDDLAVSCQCGAKYSVPVGLLLDRLGERKRKWILPARHGQ
ncbi:MAG: hypothetical protein JWP83_1289 [Mycobacterium sp.]|nr:hypothetical protein [Mycobacterium sp.]